MLEAAFLFMFGVGLLLAGLITKKGIFYVFASILFVISLGASFTKQVEVTADNPDPTVTEIQDINYGIIYGSIGMFFISVVSIIIGLFESIRGNV